MKYRGVAKQLKGLTFKPSKNSIAFVEEFHTYDEDHLVIQINYDGIKDNIGARLKPHEARALAKWILSLVGDDAA